jgi:hypothetical protein
MNLVLISLISLAVGVALGWATAHRRSSKLLLDVRDLTKTLNSQTTSHQSFHGLVISMLRGALALVEAGDFESARLALSRHIAVLFHSREHTRKQAEAGGPLSPYPDDLKRELLAVEQDLDRYPGLRAALATERQITARQGTT